jgi:hypothetical protein
VNRSGYDTKGVQLPERLATALAAAEIPASKQGPARRAGLNEPERTLYFWILHRFRGGGKPSRAELQTRAERLGLDLDSALATLRREDLVHLGGDGEVTVAYPFSGLPTAHRVRFPDGRTAFAMCAIDALGIAPMFDTPIEVSSRDPLSGDEFQARLALDGTGTWEPDSAVVVAGVSDRQALSFSGCCPVLNFFVSGENAERWLHEHPHVRGQVISIEDAILSGRAVFGNVLGED